MNNRTGVFLGVEYTKNQSPFCKDPNVATSNLGIEHNFYETAKKNLQINGVYTHHSCVNGPDADNYDAVGIETKYFFRNKR